MTAHEFLQRLKILPKIIENCEIEKQKWEDRAYNTTSGGVTIKLLDKKGEEELHNMEKVQSSSCGDTVGIAVANYVDLERKIEALKAEKEGLENILEQLEPNQYDIIYKFFILKFYNYEIADVMDVSCSYVEKHKKKGLENLQNLLDCTENYGMLQHITQHIDSNL